MEERLYASLMLGKKPEDLEDVLKECVSFVERTQYEASDEDFDVLFAITLFLYKLGPIEVANHPTAETCVKMLEEFVPDSPSSRKRSSTVRDVTLFPYLYKLSPGIVNERSVQGVARALLNLRYTASPKEALLIYKGLQMVNKYQDRPIGVQLVK